MQKQDFIGLSAVLTGYSTADLAPQLDPTDISGILFTELTKPGNGVNPGDLDLLTTLWSSISALPLAQQESKVRDFFSDATKTGATRLAQNIIYMWFVGVWYDVSKNPATFSLTSNDHVVSPLAYTNGLVWGEMGAHPMGYSEGAFGYWGDVPSLPAID